MKRQKLIPTLVLTSLGLAAAFGCAKKEEPVPPAEEGEAAAAMQEAVDATAAATAEMKEKVEETTE
jgi:hypothetical protein